MGKIRNRFVAALLIAGLAAFPAAVEAHFVTGSEMVSQPRSTPQYTDDGNTYGPFGWTASYTRTFDGMMLTKNVEIDFMFDPALNFTEAQKAAYRASAEMSIEGVWNGKFNITDSATGAVFPVKVDVTTTGPFNQTVTVRQMQGVGNPPYNMTNWYINQDTASFQAHEFGHMLGLFDEYIGGAVDQYPNPTLSNDGLMGLGALNANPVMYPRYFQQYLDYMKTLNPEDDHNFALTYNPEPSTLVLACIGAGCAFIVRRRQRRLAAA